MEKIGECVYRLILEGSDVYVAVMSVVEGYKMDIKAPFNLSSAWLSEKDQELRKTYSSDEVLAVLRRKLREVKTSLREEKEKNKNFEEELESLFDEEEKDV